MLFRSNGIYGQNGSGKTAIIEAFDILQHVMSGNTISYDEYEGMFNDDNLMKVSTVFYIEFGEKKYKAKYELLLKRNIEEKKIQIYSENIIYWQRGKSWKKKRNIFQYVPNPAHKIPQKIFCTLSLFDKINKLQFFIVYYIIIAI